MKKLNDLLSNIRSNWFADFLVELFVKKTTPLNNIEWIFANERQRWNYFDQYVQIAAFWHSYAWYSLAIASLFAYRWSKQYNDMSNHTLYQNMNSRTPIKWAFTCWRTECAVSQTPNISNVHMIKPLDCATLLWNIIVEVFIDMNAKIITDIITAVTYCKKSIEWSVSNWCINSLKDNHSKVILRNFSWSWPRISIPWD